MTGKRSYTNEEIIAALTALELNGGNMKRTARELGIPEPTLRTWFQRARGEIGLEAISNHPHEHDFATIWAEVQHAAALRMMQLIPTSTNLRDVSIAAGIATDKFLDHTQGRKGMTINVDNSKTVNLGADALLGALLRQQAAGAGGPSDDDDDAGHRGVIVDVTPSSFSSGSDSDSGEAA